MLTILLQASVAILALAFGAAASVVARRMHECEGAHRLSWAVVAVGFVVGGISSIVQNAGAVWAFAAGPDSAAWTEFLRWAPAGNYGRTLLRVALAISLACVPAARYFRGQFWSMSAMLFGGAILAGAWIGVAEGSLKEGVHYPNLAILETLEVVTLLFALFLAATADSMDRLLWIGICVYVVRQALNVISWSAFAWVGVPGAWIPHPWHIHVYGVVGYGIMIGLALHRLRLARRGVQVSGLLELPAPRKFSTLG
jgi:hypothetical protein